MQKERLEFIDNTRALCMLWIIGIWHLSGYLRININVANPVTNGCTNGALAAFTFISAYFLGQKNISTNLDIVNFLKKRFWRIYPLFFISCTTLLIIYYLFKIEYINSFVQYILTLLGISVFVGMAPQTIWFISMLILFYAITPFILKCSIKQKINILVVAEILLVTLDQIYDKFDSRITLLFPFYAIGLLITNWRRLTSKFQIVHFISCAIIFAFFVVFDWKFPNLFFKFVSATAFVVIILELGKICLWSTIVTQLFKWISYASMVAYLFHRQFFGGIQFFVGKYPVWLAYLIILPIFLVGSYIVQFVYDSIVLQIPVVGKSIK